jgi:hypothetical protein
VVSVGESQCDLESRIPEDLSVEAALAMIAKVVGNDCITPKEVVLAVSALASK